MDMNRMMLKLQEGLQAASAHAMGRSHQGIDSLSLNPDAVLKTTVAVLGMENVLQR